MIHRRIHQIWVGPDPLPVRERGFIEELKQHNPGFEHTLWTDQNLPEMPAHVRAVYDEFGSRKQYAFQADILRMLVVYLYGGMYLDIDFRCQQSLETLFDWDRSELVLWYHDIHDFTVPNNVFAAEKGNTFFSYILADIRLGEVWYGPSWWGREIRKFLFLKPEATYLEVEQAGAAHHLKYLSYPEFEHRYCRHWSLYSWSPENRTRIEKMTDMKAAITALKPASIHDIIPSEFFTKYDSYDYVWSGNCFEWYYAFAKYIQPKSILEFGVRFGFSLLPMMLGTEQKQLFVRGYDNESYGNNKAASDGIHSVILRSAHGIIGGTGFTGDTPQWTTSTNVGWINFAIEKTNSQDIKELPQWFDLISIDGDHSYDGKINDLNLTLGKTKYVVIDDYHYIPDVRRSTDDFVRDHHNQIEDTIEFDTFRGTLLIVYKT